MLFSEKTIAQNDGKPGLAQMDDTLALVADSMFTCFIPDERPLYCEKFIRGLVRALKTPNSYAYAFPKLREKINIIAPEDGSFRIFNWVIAPSQNSRRYYGAVQMPGEHLKLFPLIDYSPEVAKDFTDSIFTNTKWYGALYYRIIKTEQNGEPFYTALGLNAGSPIANKKIMEPLIFEQDKIVFGAPVFAVKNELNQPINRFVMEYKKDIQASMNWDNNQKLVYFDRLVSSVNDPNRKYTFVPSGQYDGFRWSDGQWQFVADLIPVQNFKDGEAPAPSPLIQKQK